MFYLLMWAKQSRCYHNESVVLHFSSSVQFPVHAGNHIWSVSNVKLQISWS